MMRAARQTVTREHPARIAFAEALKRPNTSEHELARLADEFPVQSDESFPVRVVRTLDLRPFFAIGGFALADQAYQVMWEHYWWVGDVLGCNAIVEGRERALVAFRHSGDLEAKDLWPGDVDQHFWRYLVFSARVASRLDAEALARITMPSKDGWSKVRRRFDLPSLYIQAHGPQRAPWHGIAGHKLEGLRVFLRQVFGRSLLHGGWLARHGGLFLDDGDVDTIIGLAVEGGLVVRGKRELYVGQHPDKSDRPTRFNWMPVETPAVRTTVADLIAVNREP